MHVTSNLMAVLKPDPVLTTNLTMAGRVHVTVAPCPPRSPRALCLARERKAQALSSLLNVSVAYNSWNETASLPVVTVSVSLGSRTVAPRPLPSDELDARFVPVGQNATIEMLRDALAGNRMFRCVIEDATSPFTEGLGFTPVFVLFAPVAIQHPSPKAVSEYTLMTTVVAEEAFEYAFGITNLPGYLFPDSDYVV